MPRLEDRSCHDWPGDNADLLRTSGDRGCVMSFRDPSQCHRLATRPSYNDHMTIKMTATDVKARLLGVLDEVQAGEDVEITRHGRTIARLVPATGAHALEGALSGMARTVGAETDLFATGEAWNVQ